jgi:CxxC-x17-CxxC domain-containing protein
MKRPGASASGLFCFRGTRYTRRRLNGPQPSSQEGEPFVTTFLDRTLVCRDCGIEFTFTAGEQEFYQSKGLLNEPGRCPECRALRREGRSVTRARAMHEVVCAVCGTTTEVPFLPTQGRPVYCQDCFQQIRTRA